MTAAAKIPDPETPPAARPVVVAIGLDDEALAVIRPLIPASVTLIVYTFTEVTATLKDAVAKATLTLMLWDGQRKRAHVLLTALKDSQKEQSLGRTFMVLSGDKSPERLQPRIARALGIHGWFEIPKRFFELQRLLFEIAPRDSGEAEQTHIDREIQAADTKKLQLKAPVDIDVEAAALGVVEAWAALKRQSGASTKQKHMALYHPSSGFAVELERALLECGAEVVTVVTSPDDALRLCRRGVDALILWFDGSESAAAAILEHLIECRRMPWVPVLVMIPDKAVLASVSTRISWLPFDAIVTYDRKAATLRDALTKLADASQQVDSARGLLERLRAPLRPEAAPAFKSQCTPATVQVLSQRLGEKPGKRYWAACELIPYHLLHGKPAEAQTLLDEIKTLRPKAYTTVFMQHVVGHQTGDRGKNAAAFVETMLELPGSGADRLLRVGMILDRWKQTEALGRLVDGWSARGDAATSPEIHYVAGRYYALDNKPHLSGAHLAQAVTLDPLRRELVDGLARHLSDIKAYDKAIRLFQVIASTAFVPWETRVRYAQTLVTYRRFKEAKDLIANLLSEEPGNKEVLALQAKVS